LLDIGTSGTTAPTVGVHDGDMSEDETFTEWVDISELDGAAIEFLWTGANALGAFTVEGSVAGPGQDLGIDVTANDPDGTAHAGDLDADDLRAEDLGVSLVNIGGIEFPWIRGKYTKTSGEGTWNARLHGKRA